MPLERWPAPPPPLGGGGSSGPMWHMVAPGPPGGLWWPLWPLVAPGLRIQILTSLGASAPPGASCGPWALWWPWLNDPWKQNETRLILTDVHKFPDSYSCSCSCSCSFVRNDVKLKALFACWWVPALPGKPQQPVGWVASNERNSGAGMECGVGQPPHFICLPR